MSSGTHALVTGAAGFIGSHLVERLVRDGWMVRAFVHYNAANYRHNLERLAPEIRGALEVVAGDIADPFSVNHAVAGQDVVFHLASLIAIPYSYLAPAAYVSTNVTGTLNVLQACREHGVTRLVHTSTSETYGTAQYVPIDEQHPLVGQSPYSASKIAADKLAESFHRSYELPVVTVRPFNTFGPRQSARAVVPTIICQALTLDEIRIGSLNPVRDFTYVEDTAAGFVAAARCDQAVGEVVNLGTGAGVSIGDIVGKVRERINRDVRVRTDEGRVRPEASEVLRLISDNSKAKRLMGWTPTVNFDTGLERVIDYIRTHPEQYKAEIYNV
jgi:NAD dependent epimerase/dehydratase